MKLNWFSPLPPARTGIAHYTMRVLAALARLSRVTLWTDQKKWDKELQDYAEVRPFHPAQIAWPELNRADICIYHIGNNPLFHGSIWQASRQHAGLVVLHDTHLHRFFDGIYRAQQHDLEGYLAEMFFYYGEQGRRDALECFQTDARNIAYMAEHYPLTQLALRRALGVVVHTREAFANLSKEKRWPVAYAPLPFAATAAADAGDTQQAAEGETSKTKPPYRLIVFGYIGHNRRLESLLRALAAMPESKQFQLDVYGQFLESKPVRALISSLNLRGQVTLHGFVPEAKLDRALAASHLAINLRYPTVGEASFSQLRIWHHGLPSLVTRVGWYATLPPDAVAFVRPEYEIEDITENLQAFFSDPARFAEMGLKGRAVLEKEHAPETYARNLVEFSEHVTRTRSRVVCEELAERAGTLMKTWTDVSKPNKALRRTATEILALNGLK